VTIEDRNASVWFRLGQTRFTLEQYDEALDAYDQARANNIGRNQVPPWQLDFATALAYQEVDDEEQALGFAQQALTGAPVNQANQIQLFIQQLTGAPPATVDSILESDRPLATLAPAERNNYYSNFPPMVLDNTQTYDAIITTNKGEMSFRLFANVTPLTVNNFVYLATQGFYDGTIFHRVIENFMAQAGDPSGTGGGGPGYRFEDEISDRTFDQRGYLAMANAGPGTNGSQFFITFVPTPHLNGMHTIFGTLIEGDDVLGSIQFRDPSDPTAPADVIERIEIVQVGP
jgi:cyclophilin family peptidyl-prolyl cis-trans isomerase